MKSTKKKEVVVNDSIEKIVNMVEMWLRSVSPTNVHVNQSPDVLVISKCIYTLNPKTK